jgi:Uma2 family endonuclease
MTAEYADTPMPETARRFAARMPDGHSLDSDEPQMETVQHQRQLVLLQTTLDWHWRERSDYFLGANLSIYYDHDELRRRRFIGPDLFLVLGVSPEPRRSWVVWEEGGRYPDLIVELLSDTTARTDKTAKRAHYQNIFRTPEYIWFDPIGGEFEALRLGTRRVYEPIPANADGLRWSEVLALHLGVIDGTLRYFDAGGHLIPTPPESALAAMAEAKSEHARAEAERARRPARGPAAGTRHRPGCGLTRSTRAISSASEAGRSVGAASAKQLGQPRAGGVVVMLVLLTSNLLLAQGTISIPTWLQMVQPSRPLVRVLVEAMIKACRRRAEAEEPRHESKLPLSNFTLQTSPFHS